MIQTLGAQNELPGDNMIHNIAKVAVPLYVVHISLRGIQIGSVLAIALYTGISNILDKYIIREIEGGKGCYLLIGSKHSAQKNRVRG